MDASTVVRDFIIENFLFGEENGLKDDTPFIESGVVDSTGILELVAFIEETFAITLEDQEYVPENLNSIANVSRFLQIKGIDY